MNKVLRAERKENNTLWKWINLISIVLILIGLVLLVLKIWYDSKLMVSPLLPKYTVIYTNRVGINIMCFLLGGLIPAIFLRIRREYLISTICIFTFFIVGLIFRNILSLYEHFYGFSKYLG